MVNYYEVVDIKVEKVILIKTIKTKTATLKTTIFFQNYNQHWIVMPFPNNIFELKAVLKPLFENLKFAKPFMHEV